MSDDDRAGASCSPRRRPSSASARRPAGCARWRAAPTASRTSSTSRRRQRMVAHLDAMVARHRAGEPLAYVLGRWSFRHLDLAVDRRVLIPRPETEVVAGVAIELARSLPAPIVVADLGTGSGAIGLALVDELPLDGDDGVAHRRVAGRPRPGPGQPRRRRPPRRQRARRRGRLVRRPAGGDGARPRRRQPAVRRRRGRRPRRRGARVGAPRRPVRRSRRARRDPGHRRRGPPSRPLGWLAGAGDRRRPGPGGRCSSCAPAATSTSSIRPDLAGRDRVAVGRLP